MKPFIFDFAPARVIFGTGTLDQVTAEIDHLGAKKVLVLSTPPQRDQGEEMQKRLGGLACGLFDNATMHTPTDITDQAVAMAESVSADATLAIGGGSTIGLGKALTLRLGIPQIAIPTTYAGSEMTPILGQTEDGMKTTIKDNALRPVSVIYDVALTQGLPVGMSITSGLNAIAHAMEALYAQDKNPVISLLAEEGIRTLGRALPIIKHQSDHMEARSDALFGAWACALCLGTVGMSLHHKLCHTIGGRFNLPHAETHAIILPYAAAYNADAAPEAMGQIARALGREDNNGALALFDLTERVAAPTALKDFGMPEEGIAIATDLALQNQYWNPRPIEKGAVQALISAAWKGSGYGKL